MGGGEAVASVEDRSLDVGGRTLAVRRYRPASVGEGPAPTLVFYHGGGFVIGSLASHDRDCRALANRGQCQVIAVDYRLAPEHPFPAAVDDAVAALERIVGAAGEFDVDPARVAVGGDSAGGNLAAGTALVAAGEGLPLAFQLLVYPATDCTRDTRSLALFGDGFYLTREFMDLANQSYLPPDLDRRDPRVSPLLADVPPGLAPAYVATAGFDPLRDEGEAYARTLSEAGVEVELERFPDLIHGFFNIVGVGRRSRAANARIAERLRTALHR